MDNFTFNNKKSLSSASRQVTFTTETEWDTNPTEAEWDVKATFHHQLIGYESVTYADRMDGELPKLLELMEQIGVCHISLSKTGGSFPVRG